VLGAVPAVAAEKAKKMPILTPVFSHFLTLNDSPNIVAAVAQATLNAVVVSGTRFIYFKVSKSLWPYRKIGKPPLKGACAVHTMLSQRPPYLLIRSPENSIGATMLALTGIIADIELFLKKKFQNNQRLNRIQRLSAERPTGAG
jgi:hypothetical protein